MSWRVLHGDCIAAMQEMDEASVDAIVTDPPYGLEFMGKEWDRLGALTEEVTDTANRDGNWTTKPFGGGGQRVRYGASTVSMQGWHHAWATEALRVLKPGGHLLAFGGTRTYHRLACAVEDAGFEIRDSLIWLYGSGFPKSLAVDKAIDKAAGAEREVVGTRQKRGAFGGVAYAQDEWTLAQANQPLDLPVTTPATSEAQRWQGWGTALKPSHEPIVVARKPLVGTVAENVQRFGTGALNVDGGRVGGMWENSSAGLGAGREGANVDGPAYGNGLGGVVAEPHRAGRWPANIVLSHLPECDDTCAPGCVVAELDRQSGELSSGSRKAGEYRRLGGDGRYGEWDKGPMPAIEGDAGGASRFFYTAKASRAERNAGLEGCEERPRSVGDERPSGGMHERYGDANGSGRSAAAANHHPTVKPIDLMRWLCRLVTLPGGTILDPFAGSGTAGIAAVLEGFDFIGIEREPEYIEIAKARIEWWSQFPLETETEDALESGRRETEARDAGQLALGF